MSDHAVAFLEHLECAPRGFGAPSALAFADRLRTQAQERAADGPLVLFVLGEPLSGKSTFLSNLLGWLKGQLQVRLIRWGDAMRAQRHLRLLPADRVPGDLTAGEFANLSAFVGEQIHAARAAGRGRPGLVVAEAPGCTAVMTDGRIDGLDRGFSTCRAFVQHEWAHYAALTAESRLRATFLGSRETAPGQATSARSATPLAANRINQQLTELVLRLHEQGRLDLAGVLPEALERDPALRDKVVFESFLPHLMGHEIGAPSDRALVARNVLLPEPQADARFLDRFDYIRERYNV